jgi:hypothetical protein
MAVISESLELIFAGIKKLKDAYEDTERQFTIDGRLVGDIGEVIAKERFKINLDETSRSKFDAKTLDGQDVQIKATFKDKLTFKYPDGLFIGLKLHEDGSADIVYNGPAHYIAKYYKRTAGDNKGLLSYSINILRIINKTIPENERVSLR